MSRTITARAIIADALFAITVLGEGESLPAPEGQLGLRLLNDLVDSYATQALTMLTVDRVTHLITANQATYTIGPTSADITLARPVTIDSAGVVLNFGTSTENEIPLLFLTDDAYAAIRTKTLTNAIPTQIYYSPTIADDNGTILLYPEPTDAGNYLALYIATQVDQFTDLNTSVILAPGYARALKYNLAMEFLPYFGRPVDPTLREAAIASLQDVKRTNVKVSDLSLDPGITGGTFQSGWYNINTDQP